MVGLPLLPVALLYALSVNVQGCNRAPSSFSEWHLERVPERPECKAFLIILFASCGRDEVKVEFSPS